MEEMIRGPRRAVNRTRILGRETKTHILSDLDRLIADIRRLADDLEARIGAEAVAAMGETATSRTSAVVLGVRPFHDVVDGEDSAEVRDIFLIVCLWCLGDDLETLPARFEG